MVEGGGGGERILHFSTIFHDLMDDVHCSAYFYHFTLYSRIIDANRKVVMFAFFTL